MDNFEILLKILYNKIKHVEQFKGFEMSIEQNIENTTWSENKTFIETAIENLRRKEYDKCISCVNEAHSTCFGEKTPENISICLSLRGLFEYMKDKNRYFKCLTYINDAKYLADSSNSTNAKLMNDFAIADIEFLENDLGIALLHYENARKYALMHDEYSMLSLIEERIRELHDIDKMPQKRDPLIALLRIGQTVSAETDIDVLLKVIAEETKSAIQADRCSVFLYDKKNNELWSKVALGMESQEIRFPADKGLAGHVIKTGETINIKDAYLDDRFNKEIDLQTGYKTQTILCMPIKNMKQEIIGAFQVLNKFGGNFSEEDEDLLVAIGSSAGIALENAQLFKKQQEMLSEQKQVFDSFIDTLAASIDARDKITSGHTTRVRLYSRLIAQNLNLDEKYIEIVEKAATLHDIGKIGIRDSVLQKEGKLTPEEYKHIQEHVEITHNILEKIHTSDEFVMITEIACSHHEKYDGNGYYRKLQGDQIPLGGRILAVSDVFDAITSKRHYRDKMPIANVIDILLKDSGSHFDQNIVDCFLSIPSDKIIEVFLTENNLVLEDNHRVLLQKYTMRDLYRFLTQDTESSDEERNFTELFQFYYMAKSNKEDVVA